MTSFDLSAADLVTATAMVFFFFTVLLYWDIFLIFSPSTFHSQLSHACRKYNMFPHCFLCLSYLFFFSLRSFCTNNIFSPPPFYFLSVPPVNLKVTSPHGGVCPWTSPLRLHPWLWLSREEIRTYCKMISEISPHGYYEKCKLL